MNARSAELLDALGLFARRELAAERSVRGIVMIGSAGAGNAREDSDVDALVFLEPFDPWAVPAECLWSPSDGSYRSIFVEERPEDAIQLDFTRVRLQEWLEPGFAPPEGLRHELGRSVLLVDRDGVVAPLVAALAAFDERLEIPRVDEALCALDSAFSWSDATSDWNELGPLVAHDRLSAAWDALVGGLFARARSWRPWRSREAAAIGSLPTLPDRLARDPLSVAVAAGYGFEGYASRRAVLEECFDWFATMLRGDPAWGDDPVGRAFMRTHDEPGRSWNIDEWKARHEDAERR